MTAKRRKALWVAHETCAAMARDAKLGQTVRRNALVAQAMIARQLRFLDETAPERPALVALGEDPDSQHALPDVYAMNWASHLDRLCPVEAWLNPATMAKPHEVAVVATRAMILASYYTAAWRILGGLDPAGCKDLSKGACEAFYRAAEASELSAVASEVPPQSTGGDSE